LATLGVRDTVLRYPVWARCLSPLQSVQIGCGVHPALQSTDTVAVPQCLYVVLMDNLPVSVVTCSGAAAAGGRLRANVGKKICCETWVRQ